MDRGFQLNLQDYKTKLSDLNAENHSDIERIAIACIKDFPNKALGYNYLCNLYSSNNNSDAALNIGLKRLDINETNIKYIKYLCAEYKKKSDWLSVIKYATKAIKVNSCDHNVFFIRSIAYKNTNQFSLSESDLLSAIRLEPRKHKYIQSLIALKLKTESIKECINLLNTAILESTISESFLNRIVKRLIKQEFFDDVENLFKLIPDDHYYKTVIANTCYLNLWQQKQSPKSLAVFDKFISQNPNSINEFMTLITYHQVKGDHEKELHLINKCLHTFKGPKDLYWRGVIKFFITQQTEKALSLLNTIIITNTFEQSRYDALKELIVKEVSENNVTPITDNIIIHRHSPSQKCVIYFRSMFESDRVQFNAIDKTLKKLGVNLIEITHPIFWGYIKNSSLFNGGGLGVLRKIISENNFSKIYTCGTSLSGILALEYGYSLNCSGILTFSPVTYDFTNDFNLEHNLPYKAQIPLIKELVYRNQTDSKFFYDLRPIMKNRADIPLSIVYGKDCNYDNQFIADLLNVKHINFTVINFDLHSSLKYVIKNNQLDMLLNTLVEERK